MKAGNVFVRIAQLQLVQNVVTHTLGGAGGKGCDRAVRKMRAQPAELTVFRTELVPPLRDAMGFVNRKERDGDTLQPANGVRACQSFRRKIKQAEITL